MDIFWSQRDYPGYAHWMSTLLIHPQPSHLVKAPKMAVV